MHRAATYCTGIEQICEEPSCVLIQRSQLVSVLYWQNIACFTPCIAGMELLSFCIALRSYSESSTFSGASLCMYLFSFRECCHGIPHVMWYREVGWWPLHFSERGQWPVRWGGCSNLCPLYQQLQMSYRLYLQLHWPHSLPSSVQTLTLRGFNASAHHAQGQPPLDCCNTWRGFSHTQVWEAAWQLPMGWWLTLQCKLFSALLSLCWWTPAMTRIPWGSRETKAVWEVRIAPGAKPTASHKFSESKKWAAQPWRTDTLEILKGYSGVKGKDLKTHEIGLAKTKWGFQPDQYLDIRHKIYTPYKWT